MLGRHGWGGVLVVIQVVCVGASVDSRMCQAILLILNLPYSKTRQDKTKERGTESSVSGLLSNQINPHKRSIELL